MYEDFIFKFLCIFMVIIALLWFNWHGILGLFNNNTTSSHHHNDRRSSCFKNCHINVKKSTKNKLVLNYKQGTFPYPTLPNGFKKIILCGQDHDHPTFLKKTREKIYADNNVELINCFQI